MKYKVDLWVLANMTSSVEIEASSEEEAEDLAKELAATIGVPWTFESIDENADVHVEEIQKLED